jgi:putative phage-type endonuclease
MTTDVNAKVDDSEYSGLFSDHNVGRDDDAAATSTAPYSILPSDEDRETIINNALDELAEIARENILEFKREDFNDEEIVGTWIDSYLCEYFSEMIPHRSDYSTATAAEAEALNDVLDAYICELYDELFERFYEEIAPGRSVLASGSDCAVGSIAPVGSVFARSSKIELDTDVIRKMTQKIQILREKPQPDQRTPEWYARRNNLITASAASKAFGSQASINQLVYEKCKNYVAASGPPSGPLQGSVNSPLHWGQRYEPLTVMVYERRNQTKLGEFGCIQHDTYPFIGASPDGINIDPAAPIYGRMVEIKNIVNREITGKPKEEYWIQTQIQMEVCDLDECDFVETRFKEYDSEAEYLADTPATDMPATGGVRGYSANGNEKGIILWFQTAPALTYHGYVSQPIQLYEYAPIGATAEEYETWEAAVFEKHKRDGNIWVRTIYWYLDEYSCVLVKRNRLWFSEAALVLQRVWTMIEEERQTGFEHRAPKKKPAGGGPNGPLEFVKIVKLDTAIIDADAVDADAAAAAAAEPTATEVTATKMATMMSYYNKTSSGAGAAANYGMKRPTADGTKRPSDGTKRPSDGTKRPSDVLIKCFKIDDLELDESKVE